MGYEERGFTPHNISRLDSRSFRPDLIHQEVHPILASRETTGHLGHTGIRYIQVQINKGTRLQPEVPFGLMLNIYLHSLIGKLDNAKRDGNNVQPRFHIYSNNQAIPNQKTFKRIVCET